MPVHRAVCSSSGELEPAAIMLITQADRWPPPVGFCSLYLLAFGSLYKPSVAFVYLSPSAATARPIHATHSINILQPRY